MDTHAFGVSYSEWAIIALAIIFTLDVLGISRSGRTARRQNADLRERNATLEGEVGQRDERIDSMQMQINDLKRQLDELKSRNVDALFSAFRDHDERMVKAALELTDNLAALADGIASHEAQAQVHHSAMMHVIERIATIVESNDRA